MYLKFNQIAVLIYIHVIHKLMNDSCVEAIHQYILM